MLENLAIRLWLKRQSPEILSTLTPDDLYSQGRPLIWWDKVPSILSELGWYPSTSPYLTFEHFESER